MRFTLRDRAILETMYASGMRVSELAGLTLGDLELSEGRARVMGKGRKQRLVVLGEAAVTALEAYLAVRSSFEDGNGGRHPDAVFLGALRNEPHRRDKCRTWCDATERSAQRGRTSIRTRCATRCATHLLDAGRRPPRHPRAARSLEPVDDAALHARQLDRMMEVYTKAHPLGRAKGE